MKREKAIKILQPIGEQYCEIANITLAPRMDEIAEAIDMAIDALKAQLSREGTTSDLISRQQAIDALNEYFARIGKLKRRGLTKGEKAISLDTVGTIKTLPSVQPEPKKGEWSDGYRWQRCSLCKQTGKKIMELLPELRG